MDNHADSIFLKGLDIFGIVLVEGFPDLLNLFDTPLYVYSKALIIVVFLGLVTLFVLHHYSAVTLLLEFVSYSSN